MVKLFFPESGKLHTSHQHSDELDVKISRALINHVYLQMNVAMISSLFCASIIVTGLYFSFSNMTKLYVWMSIYLLITFLRMVMVFFYQRQSSEQFNCQLWRNIYIVGAFLGGVSWGISAIIIFPDASPLQQTLIILMIAGVTAGAVPLSASIPIAAIAFLATSILPYIYILAWGNNLLILFDFSLSLYLIYTIIVTLKTYHLIKNSFKLRFENDVLLNELTETKLALEASNKKLVRVATHDPLTGVANRILFQSSLNQAIKHAKHEKKILALFFIDLDHFKPVNDTYGHQFGDKLLRRISEDLKNYLGKDNIIGRLGGDEFTTILENAKNIDEVSEIANNLCRILATPMTLDHIDIHVSASIGVSLYPNDGKDIDTLLFQADEAMYRAKQEGGNRVCFSTNQIADAHIS